MGTSQGWGWGPGNASRTASSIMLPGQAALELGEMEDCEP